MITNAFKRAFSTKVTPAANSYARVIKYNGPNVNVASHNDERRQAYKDEFNFQNTWGIGVEGFSHGPHLQDMNPLTGSKGEFMWLFAIFLALPLLIRGRKYNEDGLSSAVGNATNKYSKMTLDIESSQIKTSLKL